MLFTSQGTIAYMLTCTSVKTATGKKSSKAHKMKKLKTLASLSWNKSSLKIYHLASPKRLYFDRWQAIWHYYITSCLEQRYSECKKMFVVCCCKLDNTRDCDEHLFRQVSTCTGCYQLPIFHCTKCAPVKIRSPIFIISTFSSQHWNINVTHHRLFIWDN